MNWIEEAVQPKEARSTLRRAALAPIVWLDRAAKGHVVFRVAYTSCGAPPAHVNVYVRCKQRFPYQIAGRSTWVPVQRYEVGNPREHTRETRAALVRMYTELFEDRCEQTGIPCVNERRKEMKRWQQEATTES